jgi:type I restriction enzyme R subunit
VDRFSFCQFKPEHDLNPELNANYQHNICRVVPELVYSPYATQAELEATGKQAKKWRIDLVLFINGFPVATMELKSEFKQSVYNAMTQYKKHVYPKTLKPISQNLY